MGHAVAESAVPATGQERPVVAFRLCGLGEREGTLFKSFVRLLDHRTTQRWVHRDDQADVWVVPAGRLVKPEHGARLLSLGEPDRGARFHVGLPIHADELEERLQQLGAAVLAERSRVHAPAGGAEARVRLLRWPPAALLGHPQHLRLATLMTGRTWTAASLCERAAVPEAFCRQFLRDLRLAGLLADEAAAARPAAPVPLAARSAAVSPGLLGRIRLRLGLATPQP